MNLISEIRNAWGWAGINPVEVVGENDFGNLLVKDEGDRYWRICPEGARCEVIAPDAAQLDKLSEDPDFLDDWFRASLVDQAVKAVGPLEVGRKYGLVTPIVLGGEYEVANIESVAFVDLIRFAGDFGKQVSAISNQTKRGLRVTQLSVNAEDLLKTLDLPERQLSLALPMFEEPYDTPIGMC